MKRNKIKRKRRIAFLLSILLLLLIAGFFLFKTLFFTQRQTNQYTFAPTPTAVPTPKTYTEIDSPRENTDSWKTFTDNTLPISLKYPASIILDKRQTSQGRITVFIFDEDKTASLPGKITALYLADTHKKQVNGFTAFSRSDCTVNVCNVSYKNAQWVKINNGYGIKNPLPTDISNWYLTDKNQRGSVINLYVGGYVDTKDANVQKKIKLFEKMIKTITFNQ
jgi:hypothetical protein